MQRSERRFFVGVLAAAAALSVACDNDAPLSPLEQQGTDVPIPSSQSPNGGGDTVLTPSPPPLPPSPGPDTMPSEPVPVPVSGWSLLGRVFAVDPVEDTLTASPMPNAVAKLYRMPPAPPVDSTPNAPPPPPPEPEALIGERTSDAEGSFAFHDLRPGRYKLIVTPPPGSLYREREVIFTPPPTLSEVPVHIYLQRQ